MEENDDNNEQQHLINQYILFNNEQNMNNIGHFQTKDDEDVIINADETVLYENKKDFKFLHFYRPKIIDKNCFCDWDLKSGMKIIGIFLLFEFITNILTVLKETNDREITFSLVLSTLYLVDAYYIMDSSISLDNDSATIGYHLFSIVFFLDVSFLVLDVVIFLLFEKITFAFGTIMKFIAFSIFEVVLMSFEFYMLWISFCFTVHIKLGHNFILQEDRIIKILGD